MVAAAKTPPMSAQQCGYMSSDVGPNAQPEKHQGSARKSSKHDTSSRHELISRLIVAGFEAPNTVFILTSMTRPAGLAGGRVHERRMNGCFEYRYWGACPRIGIERRTCANGIRR
jgi:hypothetical protein